MNKLKIGKFLFFPVISMILVISSCTEHTATVSNCYLYTKEKDSIELNMTRKGNHVTGQLSYNFYQKDKNKGTITGEIQKNILIADYVFQSEGMTSIREVAFLVKDTCLIEGYGELIEQGDKMIFKDRNALSFSSTILRKEKCSN